MTSSEVRNCGNCRWMGILAGSVELIACYQEMCLHHRTYHCSHWAEERRAARRDGKVDPFAKKPNA